MEKKLIVYGILLVFFLTAICVSSVNAYVYDASFYMSDQTNPSNSLFAPSHYSSGTCNLTITGKDAFNTSSSVDVSMIYYSPDTTTIATYTNAGVTTNQTCMDMGNPHTSSTNNSVFEMDSSLTNLGASDSKGTVRSRLQCSTTSNWIELYSDKTHLDLRNLQTGGYHISTCEASSNTEHYIEEPQFQECNAIEYVAAGNWLYGIGLNTSDRCTLGQWENNIFVYPFMTGETGEVMYDFTVYEGVGLPSAPDWTLRYYKMENATTNVTITTTISPSVSGTHETGHLYLEPNTQYAFQLSLSLTNPVAAINHPTPDANISVMVYEPNWVCTDWSECENDYQSRTCVDPLGVASDKIESRSCLPDVSESIFLGFENSYSSGDSIMKCIRGWFCSWNVQNISTEYPTNWNVGNTYNRYLLTMTGEWASEGSRSLKMWGLPAYMQIPTENMNETCYNSTTIDSPSVYGEITNTSIINQTWTSLNITFPSTYMQIRYDHKVCTKPAYKSDNYWCKGIDYNESDICYAKNGFCNATLSGRYCITLFDSDTLETVIRHCGYSSLEEGRNIIDVSEIGINVSHNYTLLFIIAPEDPTSTESNCMYFDNVYLEYLNSELTCQEEPYCINKTRYIPTLYNGSYCIYTLEQNHESCFDSSISSSVSNKEDFCDPDTNDFYQWNNITNEWEITENATSCQVGANDTSSIPTGLENASLWLNTIGLGGFSGVLSFSFISIILSIIIPFIIIKYGKIEKDAGAVFLVIFIVCLAGFTTIGLFPFWFAVALIIISGFILAKTILGGMKGG